ncbi:MAG: lactate utilization protein [Desulfobacterales bacterium]|nr:lactate utilization protein [Desulfobacterales bacterium]
MSPGTDSARRPAAAQSFRQAAEKVSAVVREVASLEQAFAYTVNLCKNKEACELLAAGCAEPLSPAAETLCDLKQTKTMAAPGLLPEAWARFRELCRPHGIRLTDGSLRDHLAGIDIGVTIADYGIAETGTLVIDSSSEAVRLATMISEIHVAILPLSRLRETAYELESELSAYMQTPANYLAFITGASRTADIERVLTIGVHGPLELHILLLEDR